MNKEELLDKKTFVSLFSIDNEIDRALKEVELREIAKSYGCIREFNKIFNSFDKAMKRKVMIDNEIIATDIPLKGLKGGSYICNDKGITKDGYVVCYHPIIPVEIYTNNHTGREKIKIAFYKGGVWNYFITDKTSISIASKIIYLSEKGVEVTSENAKWLVSYFSEVINNNPSIPRKESVSSVGWNGDDFIPYNKDIFFDGVDDFKAIYDSLKEKGDKKKWFELVNKTRENKYNQIVMATTFASPLLEKLNLTPFIVNLWSSRSGTGKTVAGMIAMSSWGNPASGGLHFSTNNTTNFYVRTASFLKNITMFCDELQIVKHSRDIKLDSLVMDLCNGKEKGRANRDNEVRDVRTWYNNFIFTNNDELAKPNMGEQTFNRIIDIECNEVLVENGNKVVNIIKNNYGFAGKEYINYIKKVGFDKIQELFEIKYKEIMTETNSTEKQAMCMATILVANKLSQECLFPNEEELTVADIECCLNNKDEIETWRNAYDFLLSVIAENSKKFDENGFTAIWGRKDGFVCVINKEVLERELKKGNFEFNSVKKEWAERKLLEKNSQGRFYTLTTVFGEKANYVTINLTDNLEKDENLT